ncbi:MAG: type II toxin-antitoxin system VapB family antitoxin [Nocardioidaceae bacterium]
MALSIKADEADRLARALTHETGETLTESVTTALRERLERVRARQRVDTISRLDKLRVEYLGHGVADERNPDEIIGYDEHGAPA